MHIRSVSTKKGHSYQAIIKQGGKRITKQFKLKRDAQAWGDSMAGDTELLDHVSLGNKTTLSKLIDLYLENYEGKDRSSPARMNYWKEEIGHLKLSQITAQLVSRHLEILGSKPAARNNTKGLGRAIGPATVNRYRQALSSVMSYGVDTHKISINPILNKKVKARKEPKAVERYLSDKERESLLEACKNSGWSGLHVIVSLALATGTRRGELEKLTWANVNFEGRRITLEDTKNGSTRVVPVVPDVLALLKAWRGECGLSSPLVFAAKTDPTKPAPFEDYWQTAMTEAGIKDFRFHDLRHTCASYLAQRGVSLPIIATILGHKSFVTTQRYAHLSTASLEEALLDTMTGVL